ncbi:hypothetical protein [Geomicrobium sp. JCM 19039]|uniref:DUF7167 family protein n=1 Tax=Geomicrobium sp. JCM 19039 TaxID=1460636 RepID=UPI00045F3178|nr:hypothetical protein [Geomicrobium sp. JCM 19039]GAK11374.1 hypothetical protein JCM19039_1066 [Geomicrobium sp. JCM 19039]
MKKLKFCLHVDGGDQQEITEVDWDATEEEIEAEFKEWVWDRLDAWVEEVEGDE